jgi:acylpyruvate hydrolase
MKLVTYEIEEEARVGVVRGENIVDVCAAFELVTDQDVAQRLMRETYQEGKTDEMEELELAEGVAPADMIELLALDLGTDSLGTIDRVTQWALTQIDTTEFPEDLVVPLASARLTAPIPRPGKITCIGLNYADHAHEQGIEPPASPIFFVKTVNAICGPGDPIVLPPNSTQVDFEAEFAVVIGKGGKNIPKERAMEHVAGYMILNDVSARDMQFGDKQWYRGKSCDTFAPCGPWIVTKDEVSDPSNLRISLTLNGETMQDSNTSNLVFKVPYLISYLSQSVTWDPGDILSTGTPPGVGVFRKPPVFLKPGDIVSITVEGLGTLTNPVVGVKQ